MPTLRDLREEATLTQGELAIQVGVSKMTVYSWERGESSPRPAHIRELAKALAKSPQEIKEALKATQAQRGGEEETETEIWRDVA
jgi:transcriptional regulator with XRE-family HTH domain